MKKILTLLLTLAMSVALSAVGTLACLPKEKSADNTMTAGRVDVELVELQRTEDGSTLEEFNPKGDLSPLAGEIRRDNKDKWGMPQVKNYVDRIVYAHNKSSRPAYVRIAVAFPLELTRPEGLPREILHRDLENCVNLTGNHTDRCDCSGTSWNRQFKILNLNTPITICGEEYLVTFLTLQQPLRSGESSPAAMSGIYLDNQVGYNDKTGKYTLDGIDFSYDLSRGIHIPVLLQATQTDGWNSVDHAFLDAFGEPSVENLERWFSEAP